MATTRHGRPSITAVACPIPCPPRLLSAMIAASRGRRPPRPLPACRTPRHGDARAAACHGRRPPQPPPATAVVQDGCNLPEWSSATASVCDRRTARSRRCQPRPSFTTAAACPPDSLGRPPPDRAAACPGLDPSRQPVHHSRQPTRPPPAIAFFRHGLSLPCPLSAMLAMPAVSNGRRLPRPPPARRTPRHSARPHQGHRLLRPRPTTAVACHGRPSRLTSGTATTRHSSPAARHPPPAKAVVRRGRCRRLPRSPPA